MTAPAPVEPGDGQESVWDYPRPPRLEPTRCRLGVVLGGGTIADSVSGLRVLETRHPPSYYVPPADIGVDALSTDDESSWCEWKGQARYHTVRGADRVVRRAAWSYPHPDPAYAALAGMVAFYPALMDACFVGDEQAQPQPGGSRWLVSFAPSMTKGLNFAAQVDLN